MDRKELLSGFLLVLKDVAQVCPCPVWLKAHQNPMLTVDFHPQSAKAMQI